MVGLFALTPVLDPAEVQPASAEPIAPAGEVAPPSAPASEERPEDRSWWSRLWNTRGHHDERPDDASPHAESNGQPPIAPKQIVLTEDELNQRVAREAQSRHDREVARRNREAADLERRRLREEDPVEYARQDREREDTEALRLQQTGQLMQLLGHVGRQHDAVSLDPIVNALPDTERQRIMDLPGAGQGLPGRKLIVDEALKSYGRLEYERGYREAQAKLKKDSTFRKSVLAELRGQHEEPELYPGNGSPTTGLGDDSVSNILRRQYFQR